MAQVDASTARGIARQAARVIDEEGARLRREDFVFAARSVGARSKITGGYWNPAVARLAAAVETSPAVLRAEVARLSTVSLKPALYHRQALIRCDASFPRRWDDYASRSWGVAVTHGEVERGRANFATWGAPILIDQHAVERMAMRGCDLAEFAEAIDATLPFLQPWLETARYLASPDWDGWSNWATLPPWIPDASPTAVLDVVIPWRDGVLVGGIAPVRCPVIQDQIALVRRPDGGVDVGLNRPVQCFATPVVSIRSYLDADLLQENQDEAVDLLVRWRDAEAEGIRRVPSRMLSPHEDIHVALEERAGAMVEGFLPAALAVQRNFVSFRTSFQRDGVPDDISGGQQVQQVGFDSFLTALGLPATRADAASLCADAGLSLKLIDRRFHVVREDGREAQAPEMA